MRLFGSERISMIMGKLGMQEGEDIQHPWVNRAIANAQKKVEAMNFDIRKQLLDYDKVLNLQRLRVYKRRNEILDGVDVTLGDASSDSRYVIFSCTKALVASASLWERGAAGAVSTS